MTAILPQTINITQNDYLYDMPFTLENNDGSAIDLTGISALVFKVQKAEATTLKFTGTMNVVSASAGTCKYTVQNGDFDEVGSYYGEVEVTFGSGQVLSFANLLIVAAPGLPRTN